MIRKIQIGETNEVESGRLGNSKRMAVKGGQKEDITRLILESVFVDALKSSLRFDVDQFEKVVLTLLDDSTRPSRCIHVDRKITARKVRSIMSRLIAEHGACGAYPQRQWRGVYREGVASLARL